MTATEKFPMAGINVQGGSFEVSRTTYSHSCSEIQELKSIMEPCSAVAWDNERVGNQSFLVSVGHLDLAPPGLLIHGEHSDN
jgi:hypothetical protein